MGKLRNRIVEVIRTYVDPDSVTPTPIFDYDEIFPVTTFQAVRKDINDPESLTLENELAIIRDLIKKRYQIVEENKPGYLMTFGKFAGEIGATQIKMELDPDKKNRSHFTVLSEAAIGAELDKKASSSVLSDHIKNNDIHLSLEQQEALCDVVSGSEFRTHTSDSSTHVSEEDRKRWDGKADQSDLEAHINDTNNPHKLRPEDIGTYSKGAIDELFSTIPTSFFNYLNIWLSPNDPNNGKLVSYNSNNIDPTYVLNTYDSPDWAATDIDQYVLQPSSNNMGYCNIYRIKAGNTTRTMIGSREMKNGDMVTSSTGIYVWKDGEFKEIFIQNVAEGGSLPLAPDSSGGTSSGGSGGSGDNNHGGSSGTDQGSGGSTGSTGSTGPGSSTGDGTGSGSGSGTGGSGTPGSNTGTSGGTGDSSGVGGNSTTAGYYWYPSVSTDGKLTWSLKFWDMSHNVPPSAANIRGPKGEDGEDGRDGDPAMGVPPEGNPGDILVKGGADSSSQYDYVTQWANLKDKINEFLQNEEGIKQLENILYWDKIIGKPNISDNIDSVEGGKENTTLLNVTGIKDVIGKITKMIENLDIDTDALDKVADELHKHEENKNNPHETKFNDLKEIPSEFNPSAHAATHASNGSDPINPTSIGAATNADLQSHINDTNNPHNVTIHQLDEHNALTNLINNTINGSKVYAEIYDDDGILEHIDDINTLLEEVITSGFIKNISYDADTMEIVVVHSTPDGGTTTTRHLIEFARIIKDITYDHTTKRLKLTLPNGEEVTIDSPKYNFSNTDTIDFTEVYSSDEDKKGSKEFTISAKVNDGSVKSQHLSTTDFNLPKVATAHTVEDITDSTQLIATTEFVRNSIFGDNTPDTEFPKDDTKDENIFAQYTREKDGRKLLSASVGKWLFDTKLNAKEVMQLINDNLLRVVSDIDYLKTADGEELSDVALAASIGKYLYENKADTNHAYATGDVCGRGSVEVFGHTKAWDHVPLMNSGSGSKGTDDGRYAMGDHVHPTDTTRAPLEFGENETLRGEVKAETPPENSDDTRIATTEWVIDRIFPTIEEASYSATTKTLSSKAILDVIGRAADTANVSGTLYARIKKNLEDIAALNTRLDNTKAELNNTIEHTKNELNNTIDETKESLEEAIADLDSKSQSNLDSAKTELTNKINTLEAKHNKELTELNTNLTNNINSTKSELEDLVGETKEELQTNLDDAEEELRILITTTDTKLTNSITETKKNLENALSSTRTELDTNIYTTRSDLEDTIEETRTDLTNNINNTRTTLENSIKSTKSELNTKIESNKTYLQGEIDNLEQKHDDDKASLESNIESTKLELETKIGNTKTELNSTINSAKQELNKNITDAENRSNEKLSSAREELEADIDTLETNLTNSLNEAKSNLNDSIDELESKHDSEIKDLTDNLNSTKSELQTSIKNSENKLQNSIDTNREEVDTAINDLEASTNSQISNLDTKLNSTKTALEGTIQSTKSELQNSLNAAKKELSDSIKNTEDKLSNSIDDVNTTLQSAITSTNTNLSNLTKRVDTAEKDIDDLETRATTDESNISSLTTRMTTAEGKITKNTTDIAAVKKTADAAAKQTDFTSLQSRVTTAETNITSLKTRATAIEGLVGTDDKAGGTVIQRLAAVEDLAEFTFNHYTFKAITAAEIKAQINASFKKIVPSGTTLS